MSIEFVNTNISAGSLSGHKPNAEIKNTDYSNDAGLLPIQAIEDFPENDETQEERLDSAVEKLNETARVFNRSLKFSIHEATNRTMISVIDTETDKVIREIPSEEALDIVAKMQEYLGLIFDKKA